MKTFPFDAILFSIYCMVINILCAILPKLKIERNNSEVKAKTEECLKKKTTAKLKHNLPTARYLSQP